MTLFDFGLTQSLLLLVSLCLCLATTDLTNQNVTDSNSTESIHQLSRLDGEEIGCTTAISIQIKPCVCKDVVRKGNTNKTSDVILQGVWLYCYNMNLGDDRISRILRAFLSSEVNRNFTRRIDLYGNQLTKIPEEISQFKRLQKLFIPTNKITSIGSRELGLNNCLTTGYKTSHSDDENDRPRLTKFINLENNQISDIESGAFEGNYSEGSIIRLIGNKLTRFESGVFQSVLEQMVAYGGVPYSYVAITNNPFDCVTDICHLAWLIRDYPHLMRAIVGGQCSNGTSFQSLFLNDADCPLTSSVTVVDQSNKFCPKSDLIWPCKCFNRGIEPNGTMALDCNGQSLSDEEASHILNNFIRNSSDFTLLRQVSLMVNLLTRIPKEIRLFPRLTQMNFGGNLIGTIRAADFNFTSPIVNDDEIIHILLFANNINYIEPGAFDGEYFDRDIIIIHFERNKLTRFESSVFQKMLQRTFYLGYFFFSENLIDCVTDPNHLKWFILDNPHFSIGVVAYLNCADENNRLLFITREEAIKSLLFSDDETKSITRDDSRFKVLIEKAKTSEYSSDNVQLLAAIIPVILLAILFASVLAIVCYKNQKTKKKFQGVIKMLQGNSNILKSSDGNHQIEYFPYEKRWEFPKHRLRLGQELGSGAFGRVVKAEAIGLTSNNAKKKSEATDEVKTVAVKMVRSQLLIQNQVAALEALVDELKVMIYLGPHLNVVNLLGACTKSASKGEVLIIVEYCRYGNLQSYVTKARNRFVNQVDSHGNLIQFRQEDQETESAHQPDDSYFVVGSNPSFGAAIVVQGASTRFNSDERIEGNEDDQTGNSSSCSSENVSPSITIRKDELNPQVIAEMASVTRPASEIIVAADNLTESNQQEIELNVLDSAQQQEPPDWSMNYEADEQVIEAAMNPVSTRDLICWSFQIARGMDYLASKKVLHGDLAARNVLLADGGVVKVADFGLSRQLYQDENYMKQSQGKLPVKWMAPESLNEMVFSSQSDVWSFGVVLWELFSLGKTPYPGMGLNELIRELQSGYRMNKPQFATNAIGRLMAACWKLDPNERPTFNQLQEVLSEQLEASVSEYYLSMNESYLTVK